EPFPSSTYPIGEKIRWFFIAIRVECHYWCCLW
ncbi:hypothetical protein VCHENC02_3111, partial [Vibrio harveyi]